MIEETIAPATGPVETAEAVWGTDLSGSAQGAGGVGGLLLRESSATGASYYHYDGNGNVTALTSGAGTVEAADTYGPFGETLRAVGPLSRNPTPGDSPRSIKTMSGANPHPDTHRIPDRQADSGHLL